MNVTVIGKQRPFFNTRLLKIGDVVDVPSSFRDNPASWMGNTKGESLKELKAKAEAAAELAAAELAAAESPKP